MMKQMKNFDSFSSLPDKGSLHPIIELDWQDIHVQDILGAGGFSSVYKVSILPKKQMNDQDASSSSKHRENMCHDNNTFALKHLDQKLWKLGKEALSSAASDLALEAQMLSRLSHENIITLHGTSRGGHPSTLFQDKRGYFLVLDLLTETLHQRITRWKKSKDRNVLHRLETAAVGIARGLEYLHKMNIAYRDLKPQNVGWDQRTGQIKVFDLGLAAEINPSERLQSTVGTLRYMAPEVMLGETYGLSCDVYSFGVLLCQLVTLELPFADQKFKSRQELANKVAVQGYRPSLKKLDCPNRIKKLIKECWDQDPKQRPSFRTIRRRLEKVISKQPL